MKTIEDKKAIKAAINKRFIEAVEYLLSEKIVGSKSEMAVNLGTKPPNLSEILNDRQSVTIDILQILFTDYHINPSFIFLNQLPIIKGVHADIKPENLLNKGMILHESDIEYQRRLINSAHIESELLSNLGPLGDYLRNMKIDIDELKKKSKPKK